MGAARFLFVDRFSRTARLVLDVRDWYAATFRADAPRQVDLPGGPAFVRAVVRPNRPLTVTAEPTAPREGSWPFPGSVELVTSATPSGLRVFFGRVRAPGGGPLRRLALGGAVCRLTVRCDGYETAILPRVAIPARDQPPETIRVELAPGPELPPGPTEIAGGLFQSDGTPYPKAPVEVRAGGAILAEAATDEAGLWRAELKTVTGPDPVAVTVAVNADGAVNIGPVSVRPGRANRVPQTVLRGAVWRGDPSKPETLAPVADARVTVAAFPARETRTRPDGSWVYYPPPGDPLAGTLDTTARVEADGVPPRSVPVRVVRGEANPIPAIQL
jgi:hypothetical protein